MTVIKKVLANNVQALTDAEKARARNNIGTNRVVFVTYGISTQGDISSAISNGDSVILQVPKTGSATYVPLSYASSAGYVFRSPVSSSGDFSEYVVNGQTWTTVDKNIEPTPVGLSAILTGQGWSDPQISGGETITDQDWHYLCTMSLGSASRPFKKGVYEMQMPWASSLLASAGNSGIAYLSFKAETTVTWDTEYDDYGPKYDADSSPSLVLQSDGSKNIAGLILVLPTDLITLSLKTYFKLGQTIGSATLALSNTWTKRLFRKVG